MTYQHQVNVVVITVLMTKEKYFENIKKYCNINDSINLGVGKKHHSNDDNDDNTNINADNNDNNDEYTKLYNQMFSIFLTNCSPSKHFPMKQDSRITEDLTTWCLTSLTTT